jgi:hypothetical protein
MRSKCTTKMSRPSTAANHNSDGAVTIPSFESHAEENNGEEEQIDAGGG